MTPNSRVENLLQKMTVEEKVGQLHQVYCESPVDPAGIRAGEIGSIIYSNGAYAGNDRQTAIPADETNALQKAARESRHGIPLLVARDVIHGYRTIAPIPLGQAASWSPADIEACTRVAATEAAADGINWIFAPVADVGRDPRWGRVAEGYGEDPLLSGTLIAAAVRGTQSVEGVAACVKHFAGYGAVEGGRDYNTAEITPHTLRNVYLPSFKAAVDAGVKTVMSCFNSLGGLPATANRRLLTEILKDEWGFEGPIVSDWNGIGELIEHGVAEDLRIAARLAMIAGIDVDMVSKGYRDHMPSLIAAGDISIGKLDDAVRRVLNLKDSLGLFDRQPADSSRATSVQLSSANQETVLDLARKSLVLLKNRDGLLPLGEQRKIGLFGPLIHARQTLCGTWNLDGRESDVVPLETAIRAQMKPGQELVMAELADEAIYRARSCDIAIVVLGEHHAVSGEANSVTRLELPHGQEQFLEGVKNLGIPIVTVILAGRPLAIPRVLEHSDALLWAWHPGTVGARAVAEVLFGVCNPSGKLPVSFPRSVGQVPVYYNRLRTGRPLDPLARGESRYVDERDAPLFPFGFGLSYSSFRYADLRVDPSGDGFEISCRVENQSPRSGEETVQLYVRDRVASATRPVKELKGFTRVSLTAGAAATARVMIGRDDLGFFDAAERWCVEPGMFDVWIGPHSDVGPAGAFELK